MNSLTRNKEICNFHFLNNMNVEDKNAAGETGTMCVAPTTALATSQDSTMTLALEKAASQQKEPNSQINQKLVEVSEERRQLLEHLNRKDKTIANMSSELQNLEARLQAAVTGKMDALARLDKIEGKEQELRFKEKKMSLEWERLNSTIERLTEDLNKNVAELTATRQENISISAQFEIEMKGLSEQLKIANLSIHELSGTNETLKAEQIDSVHKLREQSIESAKMERSYEDELRVKASQAELYNENRMAYEAEIDELTDGINELKRLLNETIDEYGIIETRLKERELDHQAELKAKEEVITKMQQELKDANYLLKEYRRSNRDKNNTEDGAEVASDHPFATDHSMTFTEIYSQWQSVGKQLQNKDEECKLLETELKRLIEEVNEKAVHFDRQQNELEQVRAANQQHIEQRNCFIVEKVVGREELERSRLQCELLKRENDKLKFFGNEFLKKLVSNDQPNERLNLPNESGAGTKSNIVELEQRNENLLVIIYNLMEKLQEGNNKFIEVSAADTLAAIATSNVCRKSVAVSENGLMPTDNQCNSDNANQKSPTENLIIIEELKQDNHKLQNAKRELIAENNLLLAEKSLFDVRYNVLNNKIASQGKQLQKYENIIEENNYINKYLKDENANISTKLSTVQDRLVSVESQHRTLCHIKNALVVEVETSKQDLIREKVTNKTLGHKLETMKRSLSRLKRELQMRTSDNSECRVMVQQWSAQKVENPSQGDISKTSMDEAVQTDLENGNRDGRDTDISNETGTCLDSLQLEKSEPRKTVAECSLQSHSSVIASIRKRKTQNVAMGASSSHATLSSTNDLPKKKARVSFADSSEESDEEIDVGGVDSNCELPNIKLQYLSEVKTRKQAKFILDAFNCEKSEADLNEKPNQKISNSKNTRRSGRSRSSSNGRSTGNVKTLRRTRSTSSNVQKSNDGHQPTEGTRNMDADGKVEKPNRKRRRSSKRAHSDDRSNETRRISNRSRSAGSSVQKSNVGHQPSKGARNMDADSRRISNRSRSAGSSVQKSKVGHQPSKGARNMDADRNSTINHQPNTRHQTSNADGQHPTDGDCYIVQATTSGSNPTGDDSERSRRNNNRRSHRLISRFLRIKRSTYQQKSNVDQQPHDGDFHILQSSDHQSNAGHQKSNAGYRQKPTDGDCYILQSTSGVNEDNRRRSRRVTDRLGR